MQERIAQYQHNLIRLKRHLEAGDLRMESLPVQAHFLLIDKCNAKCVMCGGNYFKSTSKRRISLSKFKQMALNLNLELCRSVVLAGAGDPLLNSDLLPIVHHINEAYESVKIALTTNGIALSPSLADKLLETKVESINFSINAASCETYQRIMQVDRFDRVCKNMGHLVRRAKDLGNPIRTQFSIAIHRLNIEELPDLIRLAHRLGVDSVNAMYCRYYPDSIRHSNVTEPQYRLEESSSLFFHQELSDDMVQQAIKVAAEEKINFCHEPLFRNNAPAEPCRWPFMELMIGFDGEVYPCGGAEVHFKGKVENDAYYFGNVLKENVREFWNNPEYLALRLSSRQGERCLTPECRVCANAHPVNERRTHLMQWEQADEVDQNPAEAAIGTESVKDVDAVFEQPLVSVIIPTFNRPEMLVRAIASVAAQTYRPVEIIVVNDSGRCVADLLATLRKTTEITYINHESNQGLAAARNTGIRKAGGDYIALLDDDDVFFPHHLETAMAYLDKRQPVVYTDAVRAILENQDGQYRLVAKTVPYSIDFDRDLLLMGNISPVNSFVFSRQAALDAGLFDESLTTQEDWEFWIRLSRKKSFKHIAKRTVQVNWRTDGTTMTSQRRVDFKRNAAKIAKRYQTEIQAVPNKEKISRMFERIWRQDNRPPDSPLVSIIMLVHNQLAFTRKCIQSLLEHTPEAYELIIVDNGSDAATQSYLSTELPSLMPTGRLKVIRNQSNLGFAHGNNQGFAIASAPYLLLLNNDVVVTPGWLSRMIACGESLPAAGIVGPMTNRAVGPQVLGAIGYDSDSLDGLNTFAAARAGQYSRQTMPIRRIIGFCMLIKREVIDRIGGLDDRYGLGNFEDDDFCIRTALAGFQSWVALDCFIHHFGSRTFVGAKIDMKKSLHGNWEIFKEKWGLPCNLGYGEGYDFETLASTPFDPSRHKVDLPENIDCASDQKHTVKLSAHSADYATILGKVESAQPAQAREILNQYLANHPDDVVALNDLGVITIRQGDMDTALDCFKRAHTLSPNNTTVTKNMADLLFTQNGDLKAALALYNQVLQKAPKDVESLLAVGLINAVVHQNEDAAFFYKKVLEIEPGQRQAIEALTLLSSSPKAVGRQRMDSIDNEYQALLARCQGTEAIPLLIRFAAQYQNYANVYNELGILYSQAGDMTNAGAHYRRAVELAPQHITFLKNLGDHLFVAEGRLVEAVEVYLKVLRQKTTDTETLYALGLISRCSGDEATARELLDRVFEIDPHFESPPQMSRDEFNNFSQNPTSYGASELLQSHREAGAQPRVTLYLICESGLKNTRQRLAELEADEISHRLRVLVPEGVADDATRHAEAIRKSVGKNNFITPLTENLPAVLTDYIRSDSNPYIVVIRDDVWVEKGWLERLLAHFQACPAAAIVGPLSTFATGTQKLDIPGELNRSRFAELSAEFSETYQHRRIPVHALSEHCFALSTSVLAQVDGLDKTMPHLDVAMDDLCLRARARGFEVLIAGDVLAHSKLEKTIAVGKQEHLTRKWNALVKSEPQWREALLKLKCIEESQAKYYSEDLAAAIESAIRRKKKTGLDVSILFTLTELCIDAGAYEAAESFSQSLLEQSQDVRSLLLAAKTQAGMGNAAAAESYAERVLDQQPAHPEVLNLIGEFAAGKGDTDRAQVLFKQAIEADPGMGNAYANLATLMWDQDHERSFEYYERAFKLSPCQSDIAELYQQAMTTLGCFDRGERVLSEAIQRFPKVRLLRHLLIDLTLQQNRREEALALIIRTICDFPLDPGILEPALKIRRSIGPLNISEKTDNAPTLALCMIVKNEAEYIAKCLDSALDLVDEIIVVDTGSTDHTAEIATIMGAKVIAHPWRDDFAEARNIYLKAANADWLLVMDADEVISKIDHERIKELITRSHHQRRAYTITTRNYDTNPTVIGWTANIREYPEEEKGTGWIPTHKVRLFPRDEDLYYSFPVHEMLEPALKKNGYILEDIKVPIHHYGKLDAEKNKRKYQTYYELGLQKLEETGDDAFSLRELAIQASLLNRYEQAIDLWQRFLKINPQVPEAYINMATAFFQLKDYQKAFEAAKNAYKQAPGFRESIYNYALMALHMGDTDTATSMGKRLIDLHPEYQPGLFLYTCVSFSCGERDEASKTLKILRQSPLGPVLAKSFETFCLGLSAAGQDAIVGRILTCAREEGYWDGALNHLMKSAVTPKGQRLAS